MAQKKLLFVSDVKVACVIVWLRKLTKPVVLPIVAYWYMHQSDLLCEATRTMYSSLIRETGVVRQRLNYKHQNGFRPERSTADAIQHDKQWDSYFEKRWQRLFFYLTLMIMVLKLDLPAFAAPKLEFSEDDKKWAKELSDSSMNMTLESIKAKYTELMRMLDNESEDINQTLAEYDIFAARPVLKIFVSSSMSKSLLTAYASEAKKYDAVLIFNGLPGGSWQELAKLVAAINEEHSEAAIRIDDQAFVEYGITSVPAIVLAKEGQCLAQQTCRHIFDKVVGNLDIRAALEMFADGGDLADGARGILDSK